MNKLLKMGTALCVLAGLVVPVYAQNDVSIDLLAAGDVMVHSPQAKAARTKNGYDFTNNYTYVKGAIKKADLSMVNIETPITGKAPQGYPTFNGPTALPRDLHKVGFDVAFTANNHMMDQGYSGTQATLRNIRRYNLTTVGSRLTSDSNYYKHPYIIKSVKGINVGIIAYTYNTSKNPVTVNGIRAGKASSLINTINEKSFASQDYKKIRSDIKGVKKAGAKMVIVYYHWGIEYKRQPNSLQKSIAKKTADLGADLIVASHPHVVEPAAVITSKDGRHVPVFYSTGNYISNQRKRYCAQGMMAKVRASFKYGKLVATKCTVIPTWVDKYMSKGHAYYKIINLNDNLSKNPTLKVSHHQKDALTARQDLTSLMGKSWIKGKIIQRR